MNPAFAMPMFVNASHFSFAALDANGDLSLDDAVPPTLTEAEVTSIRNSLVDRFQALAQSIRAGETSADIIAGNGATIESVAGSLEMMYAPPDGSDSILSKWGDRGLEVAHGKSTPFATQIQAENAWRAAGAAFESQLAAAPGYAHDARLSMVLQQTTAQTAADVKKLVDDLPKDLAGLVPWWVWVAAAGVLFLKFGGSSGRQQSFGAMRGQKRRVRGTLLVRGKLLRGKRASR